MTLKKKKVGTGITKRTVYSINLKKGDAAENVHLVRSMFDDFSRGLDGVLADIESEAVAILSEARLPTSAGAYYFDASGKWWPASKANRKKRLSATRLIYNIAEANGFTINTHEPEKWIVGYAAKWFDVISWTIRRALKEDDAKQACLGCYRLGRLYTEARLKGPGDATSRGGYKGAANVPRNTEAKDERRRETWQWFRAEGHLIGEADRLTAERLGDSEYQIRRARLGRTR